MTASSRQLQFIPLDTVDKQPIGLDMTFSKPSPISYENMIPILLVQRLCRNQYRDHIFQLAQVFSLPL